MDRVKIRVSRGLSEQLQSLFSEDRDRVLRRVVSQVREDLSNGQRRRTVHLMVEVEDAIASSFDRASWNNRPMRDILVDRVLREELERLE